MSHIRTVSMDIACNIEDITITEKWIRYSDHIAEVERAVRIALTLDTTTCVDVCEFDDDSWDCLQCDIKRVMEELKK